MQISRSEAVRRWPDERTSRRSGLRAQTRRGSTGWLTAISFGVGLGLGLGLGLGVTLACAATALASPQAEDAIPGDETGPAAAVGTDDEEARLTGREIYARVLTNRFDSFVQESTMESSDRGGKHQITRLRMHWKDFKRGDEPSADGVLSKTLVKYFHPFEIRHSGYLVIHNHDRTSDQFVYFPTRRKVVRVSLRSESVYGTDFSFEDILPRELQDASYRRLADGTVSGRPTFTIEATPTEIANSEYSRFLISVEKERSVVLQTRYWDRSGVAVKELSADPDAVQEFDGVWVPMRMTMKHLLHETTTELQVTDIEPNPELSQATFALRRLESH